MIEKMQAMPDGCLGFEAVGEVDASDYRDDLIPAIDRALTEHGKVRFLYLIGSRFERYSSGAAWEDAKLGLEHFTKWERCAVVTDLDWVDHLVKGFGWMMPGKFRVFPTRELETAKSWLAEA
jgi:SpoIIAA-like